MAWASTLHGSARRAVLAAGGALADLVAGGGEAGAEPGEQALGPGELGGEQGQAGEDQRDARTGRDQHDQADGDERQPHDQHQDAPGLTSETVQGRRHQASGACGDRGGAGGATGPTAPTDRPAWVNPWPSAIARDRSVGDTTPTSRPSSRTSARLCRVVASLAATPTAESSGPTVTVRARGCASWPTRTSLRRSGGTRRRASRRTRPDRRPSNSRTGK